ncbi:16039_t:CDS:1 [Funneliformis caledonium]|uniref:16039_t:CDS:1 n=1 Tax=Funneliformis caledonium TaxID=1117310 RepID=A0A9N8VWV9_9GLOM|nr:16039_t:CDS:1 [Funneliformis caledonium]
MANNDNELHIIIEDPQYKTNEVVGNSFMTYRAEFWRNNIELLSQEKVSQQDVSVLAAYFWGKMENDVKNTYTVQSQNKTKKLKRELEVIQVTGQPSVHDNESPLGRKKRQKTERKVRKDKKKKKCLQSEVMENQSLSKIVDHFNTVSNVNVATPVANVPPSTEIHFDGNYEYYPYLVNDYFYFPVEINDDNIVDYFPVDPYSNVDFTQDIFVPNIPYEISNYPFTFYFFINNSL